TAGPNTYHCRCATTPIPAIWSPLTDASPPAAPVALSPGSDRTEGDPVMRKTIVSVAAAPAAVAAMGGASLAAASAHTAVSGTENFQMMTTSATSTTDSVIASGVFTAPAVDHESQSNNTAKF